MSTLFFFRSLFLFIFFSCCSFACSKPHSANHKEQPSVLVSIPPLKFFVECLAGDMVTVDLLVPPGASPHTYEPTPRQASSAAGASIWFRIGEPFESQILKSINHHSDLSIIDVRQGITLLDAPEHEHHHHDNSDLEAKDLHIWLSPRLAKIMSQTIANALIEKFPASRSSIESNLTALLNNLDLLNKELQQTLSPVRGATMLVSHPAFAYFCKDYGLQQLSIEWEGKEPTPQQLAKLIEKVRNAHVRCVFIQKQYSDKAARLIAKELNLTVDSVDPYAENYIDNLRFVAQLVASS